MKSLSVMQEADIVSTILIKWVPHADAVTRETSTDQPWVIFLYLLSTFFKTVGSTVQGLTD